MNRFGMLRRAIQIGGLCAVLGAVGAAQAQTGFRFMAWGDSRGSSSGVNTAVLSSLSNQANALAPAFTLFSGDLCDTWDSVCTSTGSSGWKYAINSGSPGNGMFAKTLAVRGNHDDSASGWTKYFSVATTVSAIGGTHYSALNDDLTYAFDYGNSHFVGIDLPGGDISTMTSGQITWLDTDLALAESRGIIHSFLFIHGPIYYVDGHASSPPSGLITVINGHPSVRATFHGHEHVSAYVHIDPTRIAGVTHPWEEFVAGSAGAPVYSCAAGRSDYCVSTPGFVTVDVSGPSVTVNQYLLGGGSTPSKTWIFTSGAPLSPPSAPTDLRITN